MESGAPPEAITTTHTDRVQQSIFLRTAGLRLKMPQAVIAVATILMHKFHAALPPATSSGLCADVVVTAALYLAAKAEECTRKVRDVINVVHFGRRGVAMQVDEEFWALRKEVLVVEQAMCRALNFDYDTRTAYPYVLTFAHSIRAEPQFSQLCCTFLNDRSVAAAQRGIEGLTGAACGCVSLLLPSYIEHSVTSHAAAAIHFASAVTEQRLPGDEADMALGYPTSQLRWWQTFGVSLPEIESMACDVVQLWGAIDSTISIKQLGAGAVDAPSAGAP